MRAARAVVGRRVIREAWTGAGMVIKPYLPQLTDHDLAALVEQLETAGVRTVLGSVVDHAGVARAKQVPVSRAARFHRIGLGASPTWNVFCIDNTIAFTPTLGVVGDLRLRADLVAHRLLGDGVAWAPAEFFDQDGIPVAGCAEGAAARPAGAGGGGRAGSAGRKRTGVRAHAADGAALPHRHWQAYGLGAALEPEGLLADLIRAGDEVGLPVEQLHAEYGTGQYEVSLRPAAPLQAADRVVLARLVIGRVRAATAWRPRSRRCRSRAAPATARTSTCRSPGTACRCCPAGGPRGLTTQGEAALAGIVTGLPELLGVFAGSVLSATRLQPGRWSGAFACWGLENREAAVRFCAATGGNPHGASIELKCVDPSANPYLATAVILGLALDGLSRATVLPSEVTGRPGDQTPAEGRRLGHRSPPTPRRRRWTCWRASELAQRLLGEEIVEALLAVRRHEVRTYAAGTRTRWPNGSGWPGRRDAAPRQTDHPRPPPRQEPRWPHPQTPRAAAGGSRSGRPSSTPSPGRRRGQRRGGGAYAGW